MLDAIKHSGKSIGREINRAWGTVAEGWGELVSRSSTALTHFTHSKREKKDDASDMLTSFPRWSILAGEVEESDKDIVVRLEVPGLDKSDCEITINGNTLCLSGCKQVERDTDKSTYHLMERAYGSFMRTVALPRNVDTETAKATFKNGVLTVRLRKTGTDRAKTITVN
jgi:HSP20 family protein